MTELIHRFSNGKSKKSLMAALLLPALLLSAPLAHPAGAAGEVLKIDIGRPHKGAPAGWYVKQWRGKTEFNVVKDGECTAIHLESDRSSGALYKEIDFDIRDFPVLHWKWKVEKLPEGADVRFKHKDDQAAQIYVTFPKWPAVVNSRVLGYIWDTTAPEGAFIPSTKLSNTRYVVIRSGPEGLGQWFAEQRNVYEDYKKSFNEEPPMVGKVSVMIDSDDMASTAESYFSGIYFSKTADRP
ncbi:MAG: DUF3047 domain-containing protein [Thermodesulfobacteriota bacterium]|nr:MAG: DUF3047 domain-containing protein [Thermodesulfobacteriota bacterium]